MLDAKAIKSIRESLGMTQTEFAVACGKSYSAVCSWEAGTRHPTWKTMERINRLAKKTRKQPAA